MERLQQMEKETGIKPVKPAALARPIAPAEELAAYFDEYVELCNKIVKLEDKQKIMVKVEGKEQEKYFTKKSGWRKLGTAYGISTREARPETRRDRTDGSFVIESHVIAFSTINNREVEGIGKCDSREFGTTDKKIEHDVSSKAYTRAANRAISDFIGVGEPSAEEIEEQQAATQAGGVSSAKSVGSGAAKSSLQKSTSATKLIKYFETSDKKYVKLPRGHPLYDEFAESCAAIVSDHPEIEYEMRPDPKLPDSISSVMWVNVPKGGDVDKSVDDLMRGIADGVGSLLS